MAKNKKKPSNAQKRAAARRRQNEDQISRKRNANAIVTNSVAHPVVPLSSQRREIIFQLLQQAANQSLHVGEKRFLITFHWWQKWCRIVDFKPRQLILSSFYMEPSAESDSSYHENRMEDGEMGEMDAHTVPSIDNVVLLRGMDDANRNLDDLVGAPLRTNLEEYRDFVLAPQEVWDAFCCWYGGGPTIARFVVSKSVRDQDKSTTINRVQIYPELEVESESMEMDEECNDLSQHLTELVDESLEVKQLDPSALQHQDALTIRSKEDDRNENLETHSLAEGQSLSLQRKSLSNEGVQLKSCIVCRSTSEAVKRCGRCRRVYYCTVDCQGSHWKYHRTVCSKLEKAFGILNQADPKELLIDQEMNKLPKELQLLWRNPIAFERRGKVGLRNLGNTCFLNSALQCLSHMHVLTNYFLSTRFQQDLNRDNPLGTGGELALVYNDLIRELWFGSTSQLSPIALKRAIARFAPQFSGYQQQDAQELLAYMLDGLHEDLNRIKQKPYTEVQESDGKLEDAIVADEAWRRHLLRNDSIFVDHIQGQFKSTVVCPVCSKVSITFDPYNCIQLELPTQTTRILDVIVVSDDAAQENELHACHFTRYAVQVIKKQCAQALCQEVSEVCGIAASRLVLADVYQSTIFRLIRDTDRISSISDGDRIVAYEMSSISSTTSNEKPPSPINIDVDHEETKYSGKPDTDMDSRYIGFLYHQIYETFDLLRSFSRLAGIPLMFAFDENTTCLDALHHWSRILSTYIVQQKSSENPYKSQLSPAMLAPHIFVASSEGYVSQGRSVPASESVLFLEYLHSVERKYITVSGAHASSPGPFFLVLVWLSELLEPNPSTCYRPEVDEIKDHKSVQALHGSKSLGSNNETITLDACFKNFIKPETLDDANLWYCASCKAHRQAHKRIEIWKVPDILILSLKRFEYRNETLRDKLSVDVEFPLENLNMRPYCLQALDPNAANHFNRSLDYDLFAVSNHFGGMSFGHYTACAKNSWQSRGEDPPCWYYFDDGVVEMMSNDRIKSNSAYILFYQRKST
uniref:ubiquitinyl hydrolase 1 n=1 Tax=Albugo laibachii Nc14 TaxID=890382 RepID=F0W6U4_9STRA|nr:ubiquitinspecific protease putative [Albugo laibachii Nc14]|eukprot:CCA16839.1 ubiquitinspecific protease putative [Albugo laibachii Nc14]